MDERKPVAFISHEYSANEHDKGNLTELCRFLKSEVKLLSRYEFSIFHDLEDIEPGEPWDKRIEDSIDGTTPPIQSLPQDSMRANYRRGELKQFLRRDERLERDELMLPIYYASTPLIMKNKSLHCAKDKLAQIIASHQYADCRDLRYEDLNLKHAAR